jgi:hypothetical protein
MNYTIFCQRCDRPAVQRKIDNTRAAWLFCSATSRTSDEVRLCASCIKTVESLGLSIAKSKKRNTK